MRSFNLRRSNMLKKIFFLCAIILYLLPAAAVAISNSLEVNRFGTAQDNALVICILDTGKCNAETVYADLVSAVKKNAAIQSLPCSLVLAVSKNDFTDLTEDIAVERYGGVKDLAEYCMSFKNATVIMYEISETTSVVYKGGSIKTPAWLLKLIAGTMRQNNPQFKLNGADYIKGTMDIFLNNRIAAAFIQVTPEFNFEALLHSLCAGNRKYSSQAWDQNYFALPIFSNLCIIPEKANIIFIFIFIIIIFASIFILDIKKKTKKHFLLTAFFYLLSLFFTALFLFLARKSTSFWFIKIFGTENLINNLLMQFNIIFVLTYVFFILVFQIPFVFILRKCKFNFNLLQSILPRICLINFFIITVFKFSLYPFAVLIYILALCCNLCKRDLTRVIVSAATLVSIMGSIIFATAVLGMDTRIATFTVVPLLFLMQPAIICLTILHFILKKHLNKKVFFVPAGVGLAAAIMIMTLPAFAANKKIPFEICQIIQNNQNNTVIKTPYNVSVNPTLSHLPPKESNSYTYVHISEKFTNHFNRSVGSITIDCTLKPAVIHVFIENDVMPPLYEADRSFIVDNKTAQFISLPDPELPMTINFSSTKNALLHARVEIYTYENPFGTKLNLHDSEIKEQTFLLKLVQDVDLQAQ